MIIKKYKAATEKEAILMAKEELGPDAVVMNVKTTKRKGIMKLFKKNTVELTAAIDDNVAEKSINKEGYSEEAQNAIEEKINSIARLLEQQMNSGNGKNTEDAEETKEKETRELNFDAVISDATSDIKIDKQISNHKSSETIAKNKVIELIYNQLIENEVKKEIADDIVGEFDTDNSKLPLDSS